MLPKFSEAVSQLKLAELRELPTFGASFAQILSSASHKIYIENSSDWIANVSNYYATDAPQKNFGSILQQQCPLVVVAPPGIATHPRQ